MQTASSYLVQLARQIAVPYAAHPAARALILTGSAVQNQADFYSDIDLIAYYDALPADEELAAARERNGGENHVWISAERDSGTIIEQYDVRGVPCQVLHTTVATWQQHIAIVREQLDVASPLQKALSGMLACVPLHGAELIRQWQTLVADYPDALAEAMVRHYLQVFPLWGLVDYLAGRDALLWRYQVTVEAAQNLLGVLAGLNHVYYSTFQFKRAREFISKLPIAPPALADRLEQLFQPDAQSAGAELEQLVRETIELVEVHMPAIDTAALRRRLRWRRPAWQIAALNEPTA